MFAPPPEIQLIIALALDLILGDPAWFPHPVRLIGWWSRVLTRAFRKLVGNGRPAGILMTATVVISTYFAVWGIVRLLLAIHPAAYYAANILLIYMTISVRDLGREAFAVSRILKSGDLAGARKQVGRIVGRDTADLDESGVARAAAESVAESTVDGILSPLFFALLGGAPLAMAFKATSTLDSMYGYRTPDLERFGWASARLDDAANFIPGRIAIIVMPIAAAIWGGDGKRSLRIALRDRRKHHSPNAGIPEAAMAGALGVALAGPTVYGGEVVDKPTIGDPLREIEPVDPVTAWWISLASAVVFIGMSAGILAMIHLLVNNS